VARHQEIDEKIRDHLSSFFRERPIEELALDDLPFPTAPLEERLPQLKLVRVAPGDDVGDWVYVTIGAWRTTVDERDQHGLLEFILGAAEDHPSHLETLGMVANYHADPAERLGVGHTLPIGRPWVAGSSCDHLLVSRPYPWGPKLEICPLGDDHVHFLWLLPITNEERDFKSERDERGENGLEELERRFDAAGIEWWRPDRPSVV